MPDTPQQPARAKADGSSVWRLSKFAQNLVAGIAMTAVVNVLIRVLAIGSGGACIGFLPLLLYPVGGVLIGRHMPAGAPGAAVGVAIAYRLAFPFHLGPTAQTMTLAFAFVSTAMTLICELIAARASGLRFRARRQDDQQSDRAQATPNGPGLTPAGPLGPFDEPRHPRH